MNDISTLKKEERVNLLLRRLYEQYGYKKYRMNKFEEYSFYLENKNFLENDRFITFNDPDGRLMALKPDVTLSIVKNTKAGQENERLYYSESIFRTRHGSSEFEELRQTGLEFIGQVDIYAMLEVVELALRTLEILSDCYVLSVSHMGVICAMLDGLGVDYAVRRELLACIKSKNVHDLRMVCAKGGVAQQDAERLASLVSIAGNFTQGVQALRDLIGDVPAVFELQAIANAFSGTPYEDRLHLDFSAVSDTEYYNGVLLSGFVEGAAHAVVTGGRYDNLLARMGKDLGAMGFAVNFGYLERLLKNERAAEDTVEVLYDDNTSPAYLLQVLRRLTSAGRRVCAVRSASGKEEVVDIRSGKEATV